MQQRRLSLCFCRLARATASRETSVTVLPTARRQNLSFFASVVFLTVLQV